MKEYLSSPIYTKVDELWVGIFIAISACGSNMISWGLLSITCQLSCLTELVIVAKDPNVWGISRA